MQGYTLPSKCDAQVNSVKEGTRYPGLIAADLIWRATTFPGDIAMVTTWTGIHGCDELKAGWKSYGAPRASYRDAACFQRFAQHLQDMTIKLGQFVEEQYAVVCQRSFPGPRVGTTAD